MICIYEANTTTWTGNGLCILQPFSCTVKEIAGGDFGSDTDTSHYGRPALEGTAGGADH